LPIAAVLAQMTRNARLLGPLEIASAKIDIASLQRALFVGVARPGPAGKRQHRSRGLGRAAGRARRVYRTAERSARP
jgi:hypothetical protein